MNTLLLLALLVFTCVLVQALVLSAWRSAIEREGEGSLARAPIEHYPMVSLLVPVRNGASTLTPLLQDLNAQRWPRERMEVIVIDDHSEDRTAALVRGMSARWPQLGSISLENTHGKKAAIAAGVERAIGDLIVLTDADARCGVERVHLIIEAWSRSRADMLLMPVITHGNGMLGAIQEEEQSAFQAATAGSALLGRSLLANGANLAFTRAAFERVSGFAGDRRASGDDQFLLQRMKRVGFNISHVGHPDAAVHVEAEATARGFIAQRLRWAGKMRAGAGVPSLVGAATILLPVALVAFTAYAAVHVKAGQGMERTWLMILASWLLWALPVIALVNAQKRAMRERPRPMRTLAALLCFPLYALPIALASFVVRPEWKGRRIG